MTPRQRIERLKNETERAVLMTRLDADVAALLALLDEWEKALREYVGVVESINDPASFSPKLRDAGSPARNALALLDREEP